MTFNGIASDEPDQDQLRIIPVPIVFFFRGRRWEATVSRSAIPAERLLRQAQGGFYTLRGDYGRAWLTDPCTQALNEGLRASRLQEDKAAAQARADRRKAKAALLEEEAAARRQKASRW